MKLKNESSSKRDVLFALYSFGLQIKASCGIIKKDRFGPDIHQNLCANPAQQQKERGTIMEKKTAKIIGAICGGVLAAAIAPYRIKIDKENRSFEIDALLWSLKKKAGEEKDDYSLELLPLFVGKNDEEVEDDEIFEDEAPELEAETEPEEKTEPEIPVNDEA